MDLAEFLYTALLYQAMTNTRSPQQGEILDADAAIRAEILLEILSRTIPLWNQLPQDHVNSHSLISFKNKLDDYMIEL